MINHKILTRVRLQIGKDGRAIVSSAFDTEKEQPFIGVVVFRNGTNELKRFSGVAIHSIKVNSPLISFDVTDGIGTTSFMIPIADLETLRQTQDNKKFAKRFFLGKKNGYDSELIIKSRERER